MNVATNRIAGLSPSCEALSYDVFRIRDDFPALRQKIRGNPLVYLDNAATSQKPQYVMDRVVQYYKSENSNIHRGVHFLSEVATREFERTRTKVQRFINAAEDREIVFVRGTTEAINLVAWTYGRRNLKAGDEILISAMEHHSNIVPWQMVCSETGAHLRVAPISDCGELILEEFVRLLNARTRLVAVTHVSNALGTLNPIKEIVKMSHECGIPVLVDGAQGVPHGQVDVRALNCDFYAFSGHKVYGPTGIGVLYGKAQFLEDMPPYQGGGDMISSVTYEETTYNKIPYKFEAGTPHIAGVVGLGAAIDYLTTAGIDRIEAHEGDLLEYATQALAVVPKLRLIGTAPQKASVISFVLEGVHPHDVGTILDQEGIAVRTGHHCAQPVMDRFGIPATVRASFGMYNTREEIDALVTALHKVSEVFQ